MRVTLLGVFAMIGIVALLVYGAKDLHKTNRAKALKPGQSPESPTNP